MLTPDTLYTFSINLPVSMEILCISVNIKQTNNPSKEFLVIEGYSNTKVDLKAISTVSSIAIEFELSIFARVL
ncbi:MAG: hypothetical protein ACRC54_04970 [Fusobacteriaceae bacterium]